MEDHARPLLGDAHHRSVAQLVAALGDAAASGPRVVLLNGPSGSGKTRITQEFYRRLAWQQARPAYWPNELVDPDVFATEPLLARKVIAPDPYRFTWPVDALPTFAWWAFACERLRDGSLREPGTELRGDLSVHTLPIQLALSTSKSRRSKIAPALRRRAREAMDEGGLELAGRILAEAGIPIPGLGLAARWIGASATAAREKHRNRERLSSSIDLGSEGRASQQQQSELLAATIAALSSPEVPAVVVVEDIHHASSHLLQTLDNILLNDAANVLVVANSWPEALETSPVNQHLARWDRRGMLERHDVPLLGFHDLATIATSFAPKTERFDLEWLIETHPNPLALSMFLSLPSTRRQVATAGGAFHAPKAKQRIPRSVSDLYRERWLEMPTVAQRGLAFAAAVAIADDQTTGEFLPSIIARGAERAGLVDGQSVPELTSHLWRSSSVLGWLVRRQERWSFAELLLAQTAAEGAEELLTAEEAAQIRSGVRSVLLDDVAWTQSELLSRWSNWMSEPPSGVFLDGSSRRLRTRILLRLTPETDWGSEEMHVPLLTHVAQVANDGDLREALRLIRTHDPLRHLPENWEIRLEFERETCAWMMDVGEFGEALQLMTSVVDRRETTAFRGVDASQLYADLLGYTGHPKEAWDEYCFISQWADYDLRVEGIVWLAEAEGEEEAEAFLLKLLTAAEQGSTQRWLGARSADLLRSRAQRRGDGHAAADLLRRGMRLTDSPLPRSLIESYKALPPGERTDDELEQRIAAVLHGTNPATDEDAPDDDPLEPRRFWVLDGLDRDGKLDEAVPLAEATLAAMPESDRHGARYLSLLMWMTRLYLAAGEVRNASQALCAALEDPEVVGDGTGYAVQIREHAYILQRYWGPKLDKEFIRLADMTSATLHDLEKLELYSMAERLRRSWERRFGTRSPVPAASRTEPAD